MTTLSIRLMVSQALRAGRPRASRFGMTSGSALALLAFAGTAAAAPDPQANAADLSEIVVTGIRKSIEDEISAKKSNSSIIEEVSAEDIGKLPDDSIADSIARLPGLAAQRTNGRAQTLAIRGLGPDFTVTTLNGREQASVNDNRTVEFDQYPAELVSAVKVFKTPDAGMAYQGIAGTADIETVRPLSYSTSQHAFGYQRDEDQYKPIVAGQPQGGNRLNAMYIDQFMDHTLGVALGAAYNKTPYQAQTREPWGYANNTGTTTTPAGLPPGTEVIGGDKDGEQSSYFERTGLMGVVEYQPNSFVHMVFDGYHSIFRELQNLRRMEYGTLFSSADLSEIGSTVPDPVAGTNVTNKVTSGQFTNVPFLVVENYNNDRHARLDSLGLNTELDPAENWSVNNDLSWSRSWRKDVQLQSTAGLGRNDSTNPGFLPPPETVNFTTNPNGTTNFNTQNNYSNYNTTFLTDPGNWGGGPTRSGYLGIPTVEDELKGVKLAATRKLGDMFLSDVNFGVNYAERTKSKYQYQSALYLQDGASHDVVPAAYRDGIINTSFFGNPYGMINYNAYGLYNSGFWNTVDSRVDPNANYGDALNDYTNTWKVTEKLTTVFVKLDIDTHIGSLPLTGNIGVQTVTADQSSRIFFAGPPPATGNTVTGQYNTVGAKYTDVLPSMNLAFALPDDVVLRLAAAKVEARPRMDDLAGGATFTTTPDSASPTVGPNGKMYYWSQSSGGNPQLRPWRANDYDISVEKYFATKAYVSAAVFYKHLTTYITPEFTTVNFAGVPLPLPQPGLTYNLANANRLGIGKIDANGAGGYIRGAELAASLPFGMLTPLLEGFGLQESGSWNQSSISPNPGAKTTVEGLSPRVINSTLFYERGGFSARVNDRYRAGFVGEVPAFDNSLTINYVHAENIVDAQIGYSFTSGRMNGLTVNALASNLTNQPFVLNLVGTPYTDIIKYEKYGAVYGVNVRYKF